MASQMEARVGWLYGLVGVVIVAAIGYAVNRSTAQGDKTEQAVISLVSVVGEMRTDIAVLKSQMSELVKKDYASRAEVLAMIEVKLATNAPWATERDSVLRRLLALESALDANKKEK